MSNGQRRAILVHKIEQVILSGKLIQNKHSRHVISNLVKQGIELKVPNIEQYINEPPAQAQKSSQKQSKK